MIRVSYKLINLNNMKDLLYYINAFLLGITNTLCFAQQVDVSTAIETAEVFMGASVKTTGNSHLPKTNRKKSDDAIKVIYGKNGTCLYAINIEGGGWALVASDKRMRPVLAYSKTGAFPDWDDINPSAQGLVRSYVAEIEYARDSISSGSIHPEWNSPVSRSVRYNIVDNLLQRNGIEVFWDQIGNQDTNGTHVLPVDCNKVYNKFCPTFTSNPYEFCPSHAYVGCTAVAMGLIMWYWQWPYFAQVPLNMTDSSGHTSGTTMRHYDWGKMPPFLSNSSNIDEANMIAGLLRDCGYASGMKYRVNGSAALLSNAADAFKNNFGYSSSVGYVERPKKQSQQEAWIDTLKRELDNGHPILYEGYKTNRIVGDGHAFVLAGYDSHDFFYINWGYSFNSHGIPNAFFSLNNLPNGRRYINDQGAIFGIEPAPICSSLIPTTQSTWETNLVELYHGEATIQNKTYDSSKRGIIYSDESIHITGNVHIAEGAHIHIAIRNMYCENGSRYNNVPLNLASKIKGKGSSQFIDTPKKFTLSPNPVNTILHLQTDEELSHVNIYNLNGQCVMQADQTDVDVSALPQGMYILRAVTTTATTLQAKFIKE